MTVDSPRPAAAVPLSEATDLQIRGAVNAVADALAGDIPSHCLRWRSLAEATRSGAFPDAVALIAVDGAPVGWAGWLPYPPTPGVWQSTTYFAAPQRGAGLLDWSRCWQIHAMAIVEEWASGRDGVKGFVSSIAVGNRRSLAAFRKFAARHRWPQHWGRRDEPGEGRHAFVFPWPANAPHSCTRLARPDLR